MEYYAESSVPTLWVSDMAENLIGSEIIKIAGEIKQKISKGEKVYDFTIGDFNPTLFPIPTKLKEYIIKAYEENQTNYPLANGNLELRKAVSRLLHIHLGLEYGENQVLIASGSRPLIYALYQTILDPGDMVVFPVPSWNNNHYTHLSRGKAVFLDTSPDNNFMPTHLDFKSYIENASLISLCSPLNPTGTIFSRSNLEKICELILEENIKRKDFKKPLYLLFDQVYWMLTYNDNMHFDPVNLYPEMKNYTIYIDGISKSLAATGLRVGWATGPQKIIDKMKNILGHIGAWAPKPEQIATAQFLMDDGLVDEYLSHFKQEIYVRLKKIHDGFQKLKAEGFSVDSIEPQAAIYLTVKLDLIGKKDQEKQVALSNSKDVTSYLLSEAGIALVPFYAFGASLSSPWYRISVGCTKTEEIEGFLDSLKNTLKKLS